MSKVHSATCRRRCQGYATTISVSVAITFIGLAIGCGGAGNTGSPKQASAEEKTKQPERQAFIRKLIDKGVFTKIEQLGSLPHVYTGRNFSALDYDDKKQFLNVVYAFYATENPSANLVLLYDGKSGKKIGVYDELGLSLE